MEDALNRLANIESAFDVPEFNSIKLVVIK